MMNQDKIEKQKLLATEYQKWIMNYVSYLFFADPISKPNSKIHNSASVTFVNTGKKKFAVTNAHVINEYRKIITAEPDVNFQLGSFSIDIEKRLIDLNISIDLATFCLEPNEMESIKSQYCFTKLWPPKRIEKDELLVFAGYPGVFREKRKSNFVHFDSAIFIEEIKSVSEESFKIILDMQNYEHFLGHRDSSELSNLGGFSGAGVFRINQANPISYLEPVGIINEGINDWQLQNGIHIDRIDELGKIIIP